MSINFLTPLAYRNDKNFKARSIERVDNYFHLGGKKAYVIGQSKDGREKVVFNKSRASILGSAVKVLSYATVVIPLIMLTTKAILRAQLHFKVIDPKAKLEKGIHISDEQIGKIDALMEIISKGKDHEDIEWLQKGQQNLVFRLKDDPTVVYKFSKLDSNDTRYENMVKAKTVCLVNQLGLLVIPSSQMIQVGTHKLIAEECLDVNFNRTAQEDFYHTYAQDLNETVKELATFVARAGFNDVAWRNIPIMNEKEDFQGARRIALVDLEHMENAVQGFTGSTNGSEGLISCVTEDQFDSVIKQARKNGVKFDATASMNYRRMAIQKDLAVRTFHQTKGYTTGKELLDVDITTLGLNLDAIATASFINEELSIAQNELIFQKRNVTLREVAESLIAEINKQLAEAPEEASFKGKRAIYINTHIAPFQQYTELGGDPTSSDQNWMFQIINALTENQHIHKLKYLDGHGYHIQA